ncbi:uncharacterized protein F5891DRAFT_1184412 [Suillus fuscotomentosus]|uniref:Uncharacterized protein n=1 Tax=Suillus fuscotomentosus TaxID=1912939 RepID=A0AAD4EDN8_9AGAM|nr:uncharacterized protein F5891DRAFT_1184412 [Suillus fuscotomentosus]KAG1904220.1 hypothetical protein F5891DRAFT_1184412 [Suillus fuscotomentosus]
MNVPNTSCIDISTAEPSQSLNPSFCQPGGRFRFAMQAPTVPPNPDLNNRYTIGRKGNAKQAHISVTGPSAANSVAPPTTFVDQNIDPDLWGINEVECQSFEASVSSDDDGEEDDDEEGEEDGEEEDEEEEMRFSGEDLPPSQPRVTRPITLEFDFQYSRDEDDVVAQTSVLHAANPSMLSVQQSSSSQIPSDTSPMQPQLQDVQITISQPNNVLKCHHKKNSQPHLPDPEALELLHQVESDDDWRSKTKRSKKPSDGPKPTQLAWYGPQWKSFLKDAKGECYAQHALENPFPALAADLPSSVCKVLISVLVAWDQDGKQFEAGIWPQQKSNMARLKSAASLAPQSYLLILPPSIPFQEHAEWVEHAAAALLEGSLFLRFGLDEYGKTRNFAHPALHIFHNQLPVSCLALVSAAYNCILDGLTKNSNGKYYPKFTVREYGLIYSKMVQMLDNILQDLYHGPKLLVQLREWAEAGWAASLRVDGAMETRHDHLQIILD